MCDIITFLKLQIRSPINKMKKNNANTKKNLFPSNKATWRQRSGKDVTTILEIKFTILAILPTIPNSSITVLLKKKQQNYTRYIDLPFKGLKIKTEKANFLFSYIDYIIFFTYKSKKSPVWNRGEFCLLLSCWHFLRDKILIKIYHFIYRWYSDKHNRNSSSDKACYN